MYATVFFLKTILFRQINAGVMRVCDSVSSDEVLCLHSKGKST